MGNYISCRAACLDTSLIGTKGTFALGHPYEVHKSKTMDVGMSAYPIEVKDTRGVWIPLTNYEYTQGFCELGTYGAGF